jgi:hypothetical protein
MHGDFASVGTIALSIEVPFIFGAPDPHALCVHEVYFNAQSLDWRDAIRVESISASITDMCPAGWLCCASSIIQ